jgi:acyl-CoA synthetase (AMP-forming)/AMP-acid ligase II
VENYLLEHPGVAQAAVVGTPDERMGEVGTAFLVRRPDASVSADELIEWARTRMANFKVPRLVVFVDEFPLTATGKVLKDELRDRAGRLRSGSSE